MFDFFWLFDWGKWVFENVGKDVICEKFCFLFVILGSGVDDKCFDFFDLWVWSYVCCNRFFSGEILVWVVWEDFFIFLVFIIFELIRINIFVVCWFFVLSFFLFLIFFKNLYNVLVIIIKDCIMFYSCIKL